MVLGLTGEQPDTVDPDLMDGIIAGVEKSRKVNPPGHPDYEFDPKTDLVFDKTRPLPGHANGMSFPPAFDRDGAMLLAPESTYSVGGGFVVTDTSSRR